jgi:hypothetical protein
LKSEFKLREFNDGSEGVAMKFWNSTQGYCIYDKFGEIISNGFTENEKKIVETIRQYPAKRSAIKFELSLQRKDSFEALVWRRLNNGKKKNFTLEEILNRDLAKSILLNSFNNVFDGASTGLIALSEMGENELLAYLDGLNIGQDKKQKLFYWVRMATIFGVKGTWEKIGFDYKGGSVQRVKNEIGLIFTELGEINKNIPNLITFLREEHERFDIITPTSN